MDILVKFEIKTADRKLTYIAYTKLKQLKDFELYFVIVIMWYLYFLPLLQDYDKLSSFLKKNYDKQLEKVDLSLKGWNWGIANFVG